jgi:ribosomal-protein-alanine N-acetyltransferase
MVTEACIHEIRWADGLPEMETQRLTIRLIREGEADKLARYRLRNRHRFQPYEVSRPDSYFDEVTLRGMPGFERQRARDGVAYAFRVLAKGDDREFIANISLRDILGFPNHSSVLGYAVDLHHEGAGVMLEALKAVLHFGMNNLNLRRIEACCMPSNVRSVGLLTRMGFEREGLLRSSYFVNGRWEDHYVWSLINDQWVRSQEDI